MERRLFLQTIMLAAGATAFPFKFGPTKPVETPDPFDGDLPGFDDDNDVCPEPEPLDLSKFKRWTGSCNNLDFSDPRNWMGGVPATNGDSILVLDRSHPLYLPPGMSFDSVVVMQGASIVATVGKITPVRFS